MFKNTLDLGQDQDLDLDEDLYLLLKNLRFPEPLAASERTRMTFNLCDLCDL